MGRDKIVYKSERADGRLHWPKAIREMSALPYSHLSSNGQHNIRSLREQNQEHYFFRTMYASPRYVGMVRGKKHSSASCISSRSAKYRVATDLENLEKSGNLKETPESQRILLKKSGNL